ncbi:MAG: tyrosine-type recombinase/integrase [Rhodoferax sp.]|nr:tyrosine-type recombinase/integrase [Rhodoferax sp.]
MGNLTVKQIENAKPKDKPYKLMDGDGLQLRIAVDGIKTWLVRYMFDGKERQYRLPELYGDGDGRIGLKEAREEATHVRALARKGIDIQIKLDNERQAEVERQEVEVAQSKTLNDLFNVWVQTVDRKDGGKELRRSFTRDVFPVAGDLKLSKVQPEHIEEILKSVVKRGSNRISVTMFADLKQMFRWAGRKRAWKTLFENPTDEVELKKILPSEYEGGERTRALSEDEVRELAEKLPKSGLMPKTQIAMWLMLSCCCRIGEVVRARWEHVDLDAGVWTIPAENSKNKKVHKIFLSPVARKKFQELKEISTSDKWCFPDTTGKTYVCTKSTTKQVRDRQIVAIGRKPMTNRSKNFDALLLVNGDWVPHDLRRTGATIMQSLHVAPAIIERVLNHVEPSKLVRTYQTYDYADEKRDAWNRLGKRLAELVPQLA